MSTHAPGETDALRTELELLRAENDRLREQLRERSGSWVPLGVAVAVMFCVLLLGTAAALFLASRA